MKILVIAGDRISDCVLASGMLGWMVDNLPQARFTIVCGPAAAPLFDGLPRLDRLIAVAERPWGAHWWTIWKQVVGTTWSTLLDLRGSLIGQALVARRRLVLRSHVGSAHLAVHLAGLLKLPKLPPSRCFLTAAQRTVAAALIPDGPPVLALGPGAGWERKRWPAERFALLATRLTAPDGMLPGARVAAFGLAAEAPLTAAALAAIPAERRLDLAGRTDAGTLLACLERCAFFVGNDSAPMHLAATAGIPTLGLYGPTREDRTGPWGEKTATIRTTESVGSIARRPNDGTPSMDSLTVDRAAAGAGQLWRDLAD